MGRFEDRLHGDGVASVTAGSAVPGYLAPPAVRRRMLPPRVELLRTVLSALPILAFYVAGGGVCGWCLGIVVASPFLWRGFVNIRGWRLLARRMDWHLTGCCLACGYDLRATPARCPECGSVPLQRTRGKVISAAAAAAIVQDVLDREMTNMVLPPGTPLGVLKDRIQEREIGWVVWWNARRYVQTRSWRHGLIGHMPFLVTRQDGKVHRLPMRVWRRVDRSLSRWVKEHPDYATRRIDECHFSRSRQISV